MPNLPAVSMSLIDKVPENNLNKFVVRYRVKTVNSNLK